jgi:protein tyrosine/serine phosphatase
VIDRSVELGGIYNMRDLGGFPGLGGRMVKTGMLYRASSLHRLDDERAWGDFDAKCVIDLRYDRERHAFPLPAFITDHLHAPILPDHWKSDEEARKLPPEQYLVTVYHEMLELGGDAIRAILDTLAFGDTYPAVFFCMAGKDRTGVVAAIVLDLLGVSESDIADDFALSGDEVVALVEYLKGRENIEDHPMMNQREELLRVPRSAMGLFLAEVDAKFGGLDGYVAQLDVPDATVKALRERLLD